MRVLHMSHFILTSAKAQKVKIWLKKQEQQQWKKGLKVLCESSEMTVSGTYIYIKDTHSKMKIKQLWQ